ncbi:MAG: AAA family ATPase [Patescibacteria group bacterium]
MTNNNSTSFAHSTLILIRGLPGSGKSYLTTNLEKQILKSYGENTVVVLDPDATNYDNEEYQNLCKSLTEQGVDKKFYPYRFLRLRAHMAIREHKIIIWNQPFTHLDGFRKTIINLQNFADEVGIPLHIMIVEVNVASGVAEKRISERVENGGHGPSDSTFSRFKNEYRSFADEGHRTVVVQGEKDISISTQSIMNNLNKITKK